MPRVIISTKANGATIDVTPEAINKFFVEPIQLKKYDETGLSSFYQHVEFKLKASVKKSAPIELIATYEIDDEENPVLSCKEQMDESTFASKMIETIVNEHDDINDITMLKEARSNLARKIAYELWKRKGTYHSSLYMPGFGYVEIDNEAVAVTDCVLYNSLGNVYAKDCTYILACTDFYQARLHFLPEGKDHFLVYEVDGESEVTKDKEGDMLLKDYCPPPSEEIPVGNVPKTRENYDGDEAYLEAVTEYLQNHLKGSNDKKVELEDDLIF